MNDLNDSNQDPKPIYNKNLINHSKKINKTNNFNDLNVNKIKAQKTLKNFDIINKESDMIINNLKPKYFITSNPMSPYQLFLWLAVILIITFLVVEYINKNCNSNQNN
jgi:hypothetical protein